MLPEFRYFSKYFRVKIGNIAKPLFIMIAIYSINLELLEIVKIEKAFFMWHSCKVK